MFQYIYSFSSHSRTDEDSWLEMSEFTGWHKAIRTAVLHTGINSFFKCLFIVLFLFLLIFSMFLDLLVNMWGYWMLLSDSKFVFPTGGQMQRMLGAFDHKNKGKPRPHMKLKKG